MAKFGSDFSSYQEFDKVVNNLEYQKIMNKLREWPSNSCKSCKYRDLCYGGCPVLWKNYSFEALKKFKESYYLKKNNIKF